MQSRFLPTGDGHRVTTLELLFDLVFVFAITEVSGSVAHRLTLVGVAQGLVIMALIWFGWSAYAWLGNQARADEGPLRLSMYLAMAGYFVVALTIREAFDDLPGGLRGPVVFVVAYAVIRLAHLVIYWVAAGDDAGLRHTIQVTLVTASVTLVLLLVGAFLGPGPRLGVWAVAVLIDYTGVYVGATSGWRVNAPGHFAERHGLVIIIAIGESLVSVGTAVSHAAIDWRLLVGALLGVTLAITLWRTYFNAIAVAVEDRLREVSGDERTRMARDVFTYLHLPAVVGIVGMAVGLGVTLDEVALGSADLPAIAVATLYGGAAVYLLSLSALRWRVLGTPSFPRLVVGGCLAGLGVLLSFAHPPPLTDVAVVTASFIGLVTFDAVRYGSTTRTMRLGRSGLTVGFHRGLRIRQEHHMAEPTDRNAKIIAEFRANEGRVGGPFGGAPIVLVHHRGRKSGSEHINPMMYLPQDGDDNVVYVFASKGGAPTNPDWYYNLTTAGEGSVERGTESYEVTVRELSGTERDSVYAEQSRRYPGFAEYERQTSGIRTIPVLELTRA